MTSAAKQKTDKPKTTPAMAQYFGLKEAHEDCLLFYRMGDFYELFFDDAVEAAQILGIALTKRGKHGDEEIPMCGVPAHSHEAYLEKLIASGRKVAICEQLETPEEAKKRGGYKAVVRREVVRIVTPGTITEENLLRDTAACYVAALAEEKGALALSWLDVSTGEFCVMESGWDRVMNDLARISPKELLMPEPWLDQVRCDGVKQEYGAGLSPQPASLFDANKAQRNILEFYQLGAMEALGDLSAADVIACGVLLDYMRITQIDALPRLDRPEKQHSAQAMVIDAATRRNLELSHTLDGSRKGSLLHAMDRTVSGAGGRMLAGWLNAPLTDVSAILSRQEMVAYLLEKEPLRHSARELLKGCPDMERALSRLCLGRGGPRDLKAITHGLQAVFELRSQLDAHVKAADVSLPARLNGLFDAMGGVDALKVALENALQNDVPLLARDGGFVADGFRADVDEWRKVRDSSKQVIAQMQKNYADEIGVNTLKIKFNNVLGYFIELTPTHADKVPEHFIHRQSLANALRYTTTELAELASRIAESGARVLQLELDILEELRQSVIGHAELLTRAARAMAEMDTLSGLAHLAQEQRYTRPTIDGSREFAIEQGRHPVVEQMLRREGEQFIANDAGLSEGQQLWLLTGPNMAGKSTFLRQQALITIMAQMGSYVPADSAHIGVVDRLFSRVGAADDLARGRSTFMVEMVETATILNQSTDRSLVILDEIGRGTATFDGLSIAWAVVEHLHDTVGARCLFATHYHELTQLSANLPALSCHHMKVKEWKGQVIFLHQVAEGNANRSYGIHVAQLAGLPKTVVEKAKQVLHTLEAQQEKKDIGGLQESMPLFFQSQTAAQEATDKPEPSELETALAEIDPDSLTPREALDALYTLKGLE